MNTQYQLMLGDCLEKLKELPDNSVDAIVTDPPYGLGKEPDALAMLTDWMNTGHHEVKGKGFMGKKWDAFVPQPAQWAECYRVLKPGGHLLAFAGTRTQDLMALGLRIAGFEIRDLIGWVYGSGFPKSLDISKAIDKAAGVEREKVPATGGLHKNANLNDDGWTKIGQEQPVMDSNAPATDAARQWQGWGTALKPAIEPITLARKPIHGTVAANVLKWRTGGINVDGCRVTVPESDKKNYDANMACHERYADDRAKIGGYDGGWNVDPAAISNKGARFPANLIHDGGDEVVALFPAKAGAAALVKSGFDGESNGIYGDFAQKGDDGATFYGDSGSAARFFYCPKTSKSDRNDGCEALPDQEWKGEGTANPNREDRPFNPSKNNHPTVKPTDLMRYLCRLITPPGGIVLDPFMGSGSTGKAALAEGFRFIGIELEEPSLVIAQARIEKAFNDKYCSDL